MPQTLLTNATLACVDGASGYGLREKAALLVDAEQIKWLGPTDESPCGDNVHVIDCGGRLVTPGLIDCHTHLVYAGDRADEFEMRLEGASYEQIAAHGGGIISTVQATRAASEAQLLEQSLPRVQQLCKEGVTTLEIKSGYGLDLDNELKMLRVAAQLGQSMNLRVLKTFLGAHTLAPEFEQSADDYIAYLCDQVLPRAHQAGLVDAVDVFVESIGFNLTQGETMLDCAKRLGLPVKAHVEQLSSMGGALMAASKGALSVDHLEYLTADEVRKLAAFDTVAVLLPGAFYSLNETRLPPLKALRDCAVPMALATDANPGSSPIHSLLLIMNMACNLFRMTPAEALRGVTVNAAQALGLQHQIGSLQAGKLADLVVWNVDRPSMLSYTVGINPCAAVMQSGIWREDILP